MRRRRIIDYIMPLLRPEIWLSVLLTVLACAFLREAAGVDMLRLFDMRSAISGERALSSIDKAGLLAFVQIWSVIARIGTVFLTFGIMAMLVVAVHKIALGRRNGYISKSDSGYGVKCSRSYCHSGADVKSGGITLLLDLSKQLN